MESKRITGFELIQEIGLKGMEFESTSNYTLRFEESKSLALLVLNEIINAELFATDIIDLKNEVEKAQM